MTLSFPTRRSSDINDMLGLTHDKPFFKATKTVAASPNRDGRRSRYRPVNGYCPAKRLLPFQEAFKLVGAAGVTQFTQGLGFDLAIAFARYVDLLADFLESLFLAHFDAKALAQTFRFAAIVRAHVCTPVPNALLFCRLLLASFF